MAKSSTRESPPQPSEQPQPRQGNAYDYDGEYEFAAARHWSASSFQRGQVHLPAGLLSWRSLRKKLRGQRKKRVINAQ